MNADLTKFNQVEVPLSQEERTLCRDQETIRVGDHFFHGDQLLRISRIEETEQGRRVYYDCVEDLERNEVIHPYGSELLDVFISSHRDRFVPDPPGCTSRWSDSATGRFSRKSCWNSRRKRRMHPILPLRIWYPVRPQHMEFEPASSHQLNRFIQSLFLRLYSDFSMPNIPQSGVYTLEEIQTCTSTRLGFKYHPMRKYAWDAEYTRRVTYLLDDDSSFGSK